MPRCTPVVGLPEYCLEVVQDSVIPAASIARQLRTGIERAADFCGLSPSACADNLGIPRNKMPQIEKSSVAQLQRAGDWAKAKAVLASGGSMASKLSPQQQLLRHLRASGVKTSRRRVPVGRLKATQKEILASKSWGMADAHLKGKFPDIDEEILISSDGHILDGHHRWAALLLVDPHRTMRVLQIGMPIRNLLKTANDFPGVFLADFEGRPLPKQRRKKVSRRPKADPRPSRDSESILAAIDRLLK